MIFFAHVRLKRSGHQTVDRRRVYPEQEALDLEQIEQDAAMNSIADNITIANRQNFKPTTTHDDSDSKVRHLTTPFHNKES